MEEGHESEIWVGYVDWRNRPAKRNRHGGMLAASFVLVVEVMENLAYLANASNLVLYLKDFMHFSPAKSAITVTNFMGTAFLLALLGGFLSDAFLTTYYMYLISAAIEFWVYLLGGAHLFDGSDASNTWARNAACKSAHREMPPRFSDLYRTKGVTIHTWAVI